MPGHRSGNEKILGSETLVPLLVSMLKSAPEPSMWEKSYFQWAESV